MSGAAIHTTTRLAGVPGCAVSTLTTESRLIDGADLGDVYDASTRKSSAD